jgi:PII-like signaling protein
VTVFFGERDRFEGRFLAERVIADLDGAGMRGAILMRGAEGFGGKHRLRTDRLLTLSEDLPVVAIGVGEPGPASAAAGRIGSLPFEGLVTVEGIELDAAAAGERAVGRSKLAVYTGRGRRIGDRPAHEWLVDRLNAAGADAAVALLGVDGILGGLRRRAGFFAGNADVPALVLAVGAARDLAAVAAELRSRLADAVVTWEHTHLCKRDGGELLPPERATLPGDGRVRRRLILYASEQDRAAGRPLHVEAVRRLRIAGATGATALRGIRGFDGDREPHGDSLLSLRRRVPTLTTVVDEPARCDRWLEVLDRLTPERGTIVSEEVSSAGPGAARGGPHSSPVGTS